MVCVVICTMIITIGITTYRINKMAFENGYEADTLKGHSDACWVKVK